MIFPLGQLDFHPRGVPTQVKLPIKATSIACGSNHSVILAEDGRVFTFGNFQKGSLGREGPPDDSQAVAITREEIAMRKLWFTIPEAIQGMYFNLETHNVNYSIEDGLVFTFWTFGVFWYTKIFQ